MKNIKKLCNLYSWLSMYLEQMTEEKLQVLENKACGERKEDLGKIQKQLDTYKNFEKKFTLDEDLRYLKGEIEKQLAHKNRKYLNTSQLKVDVCEFMLKLDNPFQKGTSMTSFLYTAYPEVLERIKKELVFSLYYDCQTVDEVHLIATTLYKEPNKIKTKKLGK